MKKFNINDFMYIQITDAGWKHLKETVGDLYIKHCIKAPAYEKTIDGEVWYRLQMHEVTNILHGSSGFNVLYKPSVMFDEEALSNISHFYCIGAIVPYKNTRGDIKKAEITKFKQIERNKKWWFYGKDIKTNAEVFYPEHLSRALAN